MLEEGLVALEMRCGRVKLLERLPVLPRIRYSYLADQSVSIGAHRHGQPNRTVCGLDLVAVAPVSRRVLDVVIENEQIDIVNEVEVALRRDVV